MSSGTSSCKCVLVASVSLTLMGAGCPPDGEVGGPGILIPNPGTCDAPTICTEADAFIDADELLFLSVACESAPNAGATYLWEQLSGPATAITDSDQALANIRPGGVGEYTFRVTARNSCSSVSDTIRVTVGGGSNPPNNGAPIARAGPNLTVAPYETVVLNGEDSSDPDGDPLTYSWTQLSGPTISLSNSSADRATFSTNGLKDNDELLFELIVDDGNEQSLDIVKVVVVVPEPRIRMGASWGNSTGNVRIAVKWILPTGEVVNPNQATIVGFQGVSSISESEALAQNGTHRLILRMDYYSGVFSDVEYRVDFLGYSFDASQRLQSVQEKTIDLEVTNGVVTVLANSWN